MLILEKKVRRQAARKIVDLIKSGMRRKEAMLAVSKEKRQEKYEFKCTTRTLYRWLKEFSISLPR